MVGRDYFSPGHRTCAGCGAAIAFRHVLEALGRDVILCQSTGCMEVTTTPYPETSFKVPWIHVLFENAASVASGVKRALLKQGNTHTQVVAIGGDGGMADIGFGAVSGALERNEDIIIIVYDTEAYSNTGLQRSGETPLFAATTTTPAGKKIPGKQEWKKNIAMIAAMHGAKYVATANIAYWQDLQSKVKKAKRLAGGTRFIHVFSPCPVGWHVESCNTVKVARLAAETGLWILYEIENGRLKINYKPTKFAPVEEYFKLQGRFKHVVENKEAIKLVENHIKETWEEMLRVEGEGVNLLKLI